jgi:hypothetical protein
MEDGGMKVMQPNQESKLDLLRNCPRGRCRKLISETAAHKSMSSLMLVATALQLHGCSSSPVIPAAPNATLAVLKTVDSKSVEKELSLVAILVKFADLTSKELPAEKFERYFKTKLSWTINQTTGFPASFNGSDLKYGITATGSNTINNDNQGIWMKFPRAEPCVLIKDILPDLPQLKLNLHLGPAIFREDDPSQWEFFRRYAIEHKSSYISYAFVFDKNNAILPADKQCLREITVSQQSR